MGGNGRRVALVIGNAAYREGGALRNPPNDAKDIAAALTRIGFSGVDSDIVSVSASLDLDYAGLREALGAFAQASQGAQQAVLYYAGHGIEFQGENYLIPVDARLTHSSRLEFEAASLSQILRTIDYTRGLRLIILDACRNNPFRARLFGARDMARGLRAVEPPGSVLVAYAAKHGTVAQDGDNARNSPFASSLLEHMEKSGLEVVDLFREVKSDVLEKTAREQEPYLYGTPGREKEYLVAPVKQPETVQFLAQVEPATREHTLWTSISSSMDLSLFEDFLTKFPQGTYARVAEVTIEKLIDDCVNISSLEKFISHYPDSPRADQARLRIEQTREHTLWTSLSSSMDPSLFEDFLTTFPQGTYARVAEVRLEKLIDNCVNIPSLEKFIAHYPESPRVDQARLRIEQLKNPPVPWWSRLRATISSRNETLYAVISFGFAVAVLLINLPNLKPVWCALTNSSGCTVIHPTDSATGSASKASRENVEKENHFADRNPDAGSASTNPVGGAGNNFETLKSLAVENSRQQLEESIKIQESQEDASKPNNETGLHKVLIGRGSLQHEQLLKEGRANPESPDTFRDCDKCPEMLIVPAGEFLMGSTEKTDPERGTHEDDGSGKQVKITIPTAFAVGRFEITFDEWNACVKDGGCNTTKSPDDNGFGKGRRPVINISWRDAQEYVAWINTKAPSDKPYRLLSEAEWEFAARGVTEATSQPRYFFGSDATKLCSYGNVFDQSGKRIHPEFSWTYADCDDREPNTAPVGGYRSNAFGLKDMIGNVWEWVEDCYRDSYKGMPADVQTTGEPWLRGCKPSSLRVLRGGSWNDSPRILRSAIRIGREPDFRSYGIGFRLSRTL